MYEANNVVDNLVEVFSFIYFFKRIESTSYMYSTFIDFIIFSHSTYILFYQTYIVFYFYLEITCRYTYTEEYKHFMTFVLMEKSLESQTLEKI